MASVHAVCDALVGTGDEGAAVGDLEAAHGRVRTDDDEPASNIEGSPRAGARIAEAG
jgi:hypothetical protein